MKTYREEFPPGTRVLVDSSADTGTDSEFNGCTGTVVRFDQFIAVRIDKLPPYWRNPALLSPSNLRALTQREQLP
jgi:hypothetical protein